MSRLFLLILSILSVSCAYRIMTFNIRENGDRVTDGLRKVASQIKSYGPDIVSLQETKSDTIPTLLKYLGKGWSGVAHCKGTISALTKHTIVGLYEHVDRGFNVRIYLNNTGDEVSFWAYDSPIGNIYAPLEAKKAGATVEKILAKEKERIQGVVELIKHPEFVRQIKNADSVPVILAGCFESPSHLDWIEATKKDHLGFVINWPVTRLLMDSAGLTDSYRELYPDPTKNPGNTWSNFKNLTPKDRIDYIFYRGSLKPTASYAVHGGSDLGNDHDKPRMNSEWPSDHDAVITDFERTFQKGEKDASFLIGSEFSYSSIKPLDKCPLKIHY